jgi:protein-disulfide isomerase/uncharacterized membrane protein
MERWPRWAWLIPGLCLAGALIALELTAVHFRLLFGAATTGGWCGDGGIADCGAVVASRYGRWAGVPVSVWGLWFYAAAATLATTTLMLGPRDSGPQARALAWLATAAVASDLWLGWAMWARLGRLCTLCAIAHVVNLILLVLAVTLLRRARLPWIGSMAILPRLRAILPRPASRGSGERIQALLLAVAATIVIVTLVATVRLSAAARDLERENQAGLLSYLRSAPAVELPGSGAPARGAGDATIRLVVFTDLLCEQCRMLSRHLEIVAANHRDAMRVEYRHFPMDAACNPAVSSRLHPGACELARAAVCAARQGRYRPFVEAVHRAVRIDPDHLDDLAREAGLDLAAFRACLADPVSLEDVQRDMRLGDSLGVTSTPTTFLNGRALVGAFKPWLWEEAIRTVSR